MRIRASFTLENSVIIPVFTMIIVGLVLIGIYMHDKVVAQNAIFQTAMKLEQESENMTQQGKDICIQNAADYIREKSIRYVKNSEEIKADIEQKHIVAKNRQPDFIRMVNAALKLKR